MNIFDLNKNSLPEQVQINKDDIATLESSKQDVLTFDDVPTQNSDHPVKSDGIYDALAGKQDTLTFDAAPTLNSDHSVTSGGIFTAINNLSVATVNALATKQDTLSFDATPTEDSNNPVTSDGIYDAVSAKQDALTTSSVSDGTLDTAIGFDTDGNLVKGTAGGGGLTSTLLWSGSLQIGVNSYASISQVIFENDKIYRIECGTSSTTTASIISTRGSSTDVGCIAYYHSTGLCFFYSVYSSSSKTDIYYKNAINVATLTTSTTDFYIKAIYEIS